MAFDKRQTNIAKGLAVLLLLWHHLFFQEPELYNKFTSLLIVRTVPIECFLSRFCQVCVAMFLFLSGFGLYKSWCKNINTEKLKNGNTKMKQQFLFVKNHLLKLLFQYWFIYVLFVPLGILFGIKFWEIYKYNLFYGIMDFMGLANIFTTPTINPTWWFMSIIIILYLLFPVLMKLFKWSSEVLIVCSVILMIIPIFSGIPYFGKYFIWFPPFIFGMYFAENDLFSKIQKHNASWMKAIAFSIGFIFLMAYLRRIGGNSVKYDTLFALSIILFSYLVLSRIKFISYLLDCLGKHSGTIFMFHTFIYYLYFSDFIYWFKYSPIIYIVMIALCYFIVIVIKYLKKLVKYDNFVNKLAGRK